jgi:hypothetical protein
MFNKKEEIKTVPAAGTVSKPITQTSTNQTASRGTETDRKKTNTNINKSKFLSGYRQDDGNLNWDRISQTLGQLGSAVARPGSWQQSLGQISSEVATNKLRARAVDKINKNNSNMLDYISQLGGMTGPDSRGVTKAESLKDGRYRLEGRFEDLDGDGLPDDIKGIQNRPQIQTQNYPDKLAEFQSGVNRLNKEDLTGLSLNDVQALTDLERSKEQDTIKAIEALYGGGESKGTGKPYTLKGKKTYFQLGEDGKFFDTGIEIPESDKATPTKHEFTVYNKDGMPKTVFATAEEWPYMEKRLNQQGYSGKSLQQPDIQNREKLYLKAKTNVYDSNLKDSERLNAAKEINELADNKTTTYTEFQYKGWGEKVVEHKLPMKKSGGRLTMGEVRERAASKGISVDEYLRIMGIVK